MLGSHKVSVIIPLYNKGDYVAATIKSAIGQIHRSLEILVIDNGSTDEGPSLVKTASQLDDRIRLLASPKRGPGHARNYGVQNATGEWILFLDADDLIEPDHISHLLNVSQRNPGKSIIAGGWREFPDNAPDKITVKTPCGLKVPSQLIVASIAASPWAVHAAIMKRELVTQCPWPEEMDGLLAEDNAFWFRVCLRGSVAYSHSASALYRTQTANCRTQSSDVEKWFTGVHTAVQKNLSSLLEVTGRTPDALQSTALMQLYSTLYKQAVEARNLQTAKAAEAEATRWLNQAVKLGHLRPTILARSLLGIAWTERLKLLLRKN